MALTQDDFNKAAGRLSIPVAAIQAFAEVESNGSGFIDGQRPKVQFEPHVMYKRLITNKGGAFADYALGKWPTLVSTKMGSYQSLNKEDEDMGRAAVEIDRRSALESSSWGAYQVMGYHWKACGYASIQEFVNAQYSDAGQLDTLVRFLLANPGILKAIRQKNWARAAELYNGSGYKANKYDTKLAAAYKKYGGV
ncbi:endolysin muramidase [Pectobacterium phage MA12]|uniref:Endolysin muramidase n=1 Tax=Pectobacterium phage MA12 TaxID=2686474 RepID=A0A6B9RKS7_9CAUD|nr:endolysin [Pectobacterium phage MA11]YP_010000229.1 endolysin [Pectobacterium phage MA12]QGF21054.1 N-acetylmuramidase family protein [Pectobacterium phage MA11]QHI00834.1 endolysin muramidase [Pectobacterium phage MA12]